MKVESDAWSSSPSRLYWEIIISDTLPTDSVPSEKRVSWYTRSIPPFFRSRSTSSRIITMFLVFPARCVLRTLDISSVENPLSGNPLSKCLMSWSTTADSEFLFLQFTSMVSSGVPLELQYSVISAQKRLAVTVFPVPTPPVRNAVQARPSLARGVKRSSRVWSCSSLLTSTFGT